MALEPGTRFGPFEVVAALGAGGMGEVYRARDARLKRDVALKILPDVFAADPDRLARFQREAEVLASFVHPHIAGIHGIEEANGVRALVLELVEGETLAERIARGALPLDEAVPIARQITEALEAAHERGIVHRDLKPANIKMTPDGVVKVLDFGLARLTEEAAARGAEGPAGDHPSMSPTITSPAMMTGAGVILGTAAYMSPEQAKGRPTDRRGDIWAFGCVLYEMLTGKRAFEGEDVSDTLAAVLRADPRWAELASDTPPAIRRLLRRCLQKDPKRRLQHIGDARLELDEPDDGRSEPRLAVERRRRPLWPFLAATAAVAVLAGFTGWALVPRTAPAQIRRYTIPVPASARFTIVGGSDVALSPDGRTLVYAEPSFGLFMRRTDGLVFEPVRGTEGASAPFFSPDGAWIGFRADGKLKKVPAEGGLAVTICDAPDRMRATWGDDGSIILVGNPGDLFKVSSNGGVPQLILKSDAGGPFAQPHFVRGSKAVLVRTGPLPGRIEAVDLQTLARHTLVEGTKPQVAATGDLLFEQRGAIWAVKFDATRLAVTGAPVPVVESVRAAGGNPQFSTAGDGTLAYIASAAQEIRSLVWIDRAGKATAALEAKDGFQSPRLSPEGRRVAVSIQEGSNLGLWTYEFERGTRLRLTTTGSSRRTVWSPDGTQVAFYSTPERAAEQDLYVVASTGGEPTRLLERPGLQFPDTWSPDGRVLVFEELEVGTVRRDLWVLPVGEAARPLLATRFYERGAVFSPDGKWLAFVTDESGRDEVYIQPFPGPGAKVPMSNNGGLQPMWSRDGRELFYREGDWMMAVAVTLDPFKVGGPRKLFEFPGTTYNLDQNFADYDVAPDGRFLAIQADTAAPDEIHVVLNWTEELRRALGR